VKPGDLIRVKNRPKSLEMVQATLAEIQRVVPEFLTRVEGAEPEGQMLRLPEPADVSIPVQVQLIVELVSR
jgi:ribosomal protein S4